MFTLFSTADDLRPAFPLANVIEMIKPENRGVKEAGKRYNLPEYQTYVLEKWIGVIRYEKALPAKEPKDASTSEPAKIANDMMVSDVGKDTQEVKASDSEKNTKQVNNPDPEKHPKEQAISAASENTSTASETTFATSETASATSETTSAASESTSIASDPPMTLGKCLYVSHQAMKLRKTIDQRKHVNMIPAEIADDAKLCRLQLSKALELADVWAKLVAAEEHKELLEHEKGTPVALLRKGYEGGYIH